MGFRAPIAEISFAIKEIAGQTPAIFGDVSPETIDAILEEAGRFAEEVLVPIDKTGDRQGVVLDDGKVTTAPGWRQAYKRFAEAGWVGLSAPQAFGGQGLPVMVQVAVEEIWNAANPAFATGPMLTAGAIKTIAAHGGNRLAAVHLPPLVNGTWTATMNLTEPGAGSDLNGVQTRAEPAADGTYRISGQKIFITYGEHDLAENIIHLVLARLPDAPAGTRGISLFLVPKFLPGDDGTPGARNGVACAGVERKLGLHGAPTCTMVYEGATGFLIGAENRGLAAMFTMMNLARLSVGVQGVGVAERACQEALAYARERRQGRAPGWSGDGMSPIVRHPDVQAMLLRMKALTAAARALCLTCAHAIDMSRLGPEAERPIWADRASLITPLAKAFSTDAAIEVASLGIQVHGGAGYIEDTGAAQRLRDARIFAIYEGTNGIQAIDLVTRKLKLAGGDAVRRLTDELAAIAADARASNRPGLGRTGDRLAAALADLAAATSHVSAALGSGREREALAAATPTLRLFALTTAGALLAKGALAGSGADGAAIATARWFADTILPETAGLRLAVTEGAAATEEAAARMLASAADAGQ